MIQYHIKLPDQFNFVFSRTAVGTLQIPKYEGHTNYHNGHTKFELRLLLW